MSEPSKLAKIAKKLAKFLRKSLEKSLEILHKKWPFLAQYGHF